MPAPIQAQISSAIVAALPGSFKSGPTRQQFPQFFAPTGLHVSAQAFVDQIASDLAVAWAAWVGALIFGGATVVGLGLPVWTGQGSGGQFQPQALPFAIGLPPGFQVTATNQMMRQAIASATINKFANFCSLFTAGPSVLAFVGATSATPVSPGVFTATLTPLTLAAAISPSVLLETPTEVTDDILARLTGWGQASPVDPSFYSAYAGALDSLFTGFMGDSQILSNTVTGPSAAITGSGVAPSATNGVVQ